MILGPPSFPGTPPANSVGSSTITDGSIVNADINASADIAGSKLQALSVGANAGVIPSTGVANAHVASDAAIAGSKLQALVVDTNAGVIPTTGIVNAHVKSDAAIAGSKLQALVVDTNAGVIPSTGIVNAHIKSDAAIASSKLATVAIAQGGTGQTAQTAAFDALSPLTTRGDMIYRNASNNARLAKGTAGHVLTMGADDPAWAAPAGGAVYGWGLGTGRFIGHYMHNSQPGTVATINILYAVPVYISHTQTFTGISINVSSFAAGNARLGIYQSQSTGGPGALILDAGTVDVGSNGVKTITISQQLTAGAYWLACVLDTAATLTYTTYANKGGILGAAAANGTPAVNVTQAFTYGTLPNPYGSPTFTTSDGPHVTLGY